MPNPFKQMPGAWDIIKDTWTLFISTWKTSIKTSILLFYLGLVTFVTSVLTKFNGLFSIVHFLALIAVGILSVWVSVRIILTMFNLEAGKKPLPVDKESAKAWALFWPMLWVSFITGLAILGGTILFIIPGIYLAVSLYFTQLILIEKGTRGTQALGASRALVKGRWWATIWRLIAGGIVFGILVALINQALVWILVQIVGLATIEAGDPAALGGISLIGYAVQAAFIPLLIGLQIKIYRALEKTR